VCLRFNSDTKLLGIYPFVSKLLFAKSPQTIAKSPQTIEKSPQTIEKSE